MEHLLSGTWFRSGPSRTTGSPTNPTTDTALYPPGVNGEPWWQVNGSLMQQHAQVCATSTTSAQSPTDLNPGLYGSVLCRNDADCAGELNLNINLATQSFLKCRTNRSEFSELLVSANYALSRADSFLGAGIEAARLTRPEDAVREAREVVLQGFLLPGTISASPPDCHVALGDPAVASNEFECGSPTVGFVNCPLAAQAGSSAQPVGAARCEACVFSDTSACLEPVSGACGNGEIDTFAGDGGEQCDGPAGVPVDLDGEPMKCSDVVSGWSLAADADRTLLEPRLDGGEVHCGANCLFDLSRCAYPLLDEDYESGGNGVLELSEMKAQSTAWAYAEVYDEGGQVDGRRSNPSGAAVDFTDAGDSVHGLFMFLRRMYRYRAEGYSVTPAAYNEIWELAFAVDTREFVGGSPGKMQILRKVNLEFEADSSATGVMGRLLSINGESPDGELRVVLGGATVHSDDFGEQEPTGAYSRAGTADANLDLRIDLSALVLGRIQHAYGPGGWNEVAGAGRRQDSVGLVAYGRHAVKNVRGVRIEVPQVGNVQRRLEILSGGTCDATCEARASLLVYYGFNPDTERFEAPRSLLSQAEAAFWARLAELESTDPGEPDNPVRATEHLPEQQVLLSDWQRLQAQMCNRHGISIEAKEIVADLESSSAFCSERDVEMGEFEPVEFNENLQVMIVLDRSESMATEDVDTEWDGHMDSRLDFAKHAGLDFVRDILHDIDFQRTANPLQKSPRLGIVWYNDIPEVRVPVPTNTICQTDEQCTGSNESGVCLKEECGILEQLSLGFGCLVPTCKTTVPRLEWQSRPEINGGIDQELLFGEIENGLLKVRSAAGQIPEPIGYTGTGYAINQAADSFDDVPGAQKIILLLTDGIHNRPIINGVDFSTALYDLAVTKLKERGIKLFAVPILTPAEHGANQVESQVLEGRVFHSHRNYAEDTIPLLASAYAETRGQALARAHTELPYMRSDWYGEPVEYEIPVEQGARALNVTASDRNASQFTIHPLNIRLYSPSGEEYLRNPGNPADLPFISKNTVKFQVVRPEAGTWIVRDYSWGGVQYENRYDRFYVTAFADNQSASIDAYAPPLVLNGVTSIAARPVFDVPVIEGARCSGTLMRPDMTLVPLTFSLPGTDNAYFRARLGPSDLQMAGTYFATVRCATVAGAKRILGESLPGFPTLPEFDRSVPVFSRSKVLTFRVKNGALPPVPGWNGNNQDTAILDQNGLPPGFAPVVPFLDDADGDNIPNDSEPVDIDSDGDGLPDGFDSDANGNDIPDGTDPDLPYGPGGVGTGELCSISSSARCCTSIGRCAGPTSSIVLYAEGALHVHDGVHVSGERRTSVNRGHDVSRVGVEAIVGTVVSSAPADLRDRSMVAGALVAPQVQRGNSVVIHEGPVVGNADAVISLTSFTPPTFAGGAAIHLEPDQVRVVSPGSFGSVTVKPRAELHLTVGDYYFSNFDVQADAELVIDAGAGPVRVFVQGTFQWAGFTTITGGDEAEFFVATFGTSDVHLNRAFRGTVVAPRASLHLGNLNGIGSHVGSFFARNVDVHQHGEVRGLPFRHPWLGSGLVAPQASCEDGVRNQNESDVDCGGLCEACSEGSSCVSSGDCGDGTACSDGICAEPQAGTCSPATAIDLGTPGTSSAVAGNACLRVQSGYPSWWGSRNLQLQSQSGGHGYPVPYSWSNSCSGGSGSGVLTGDWVSAVLPSVSAACPTLIRLQGSTSSSVTVTYYGN